MADFAFTLGGYQFQGFGIPEEVNGGGAQALVTHKLIGGARTVDAMGPDDDKIRWAGRFRGPDALDNVQTLDQMRRAGQAVQFTYSVFSYLVVIEKFTFKTEREYEIPYEIVLEVVQDQSAASGQDAGGGAAEDVQSDATLAQTTAGGSSVVQSIVDGVQSATQQLQGVVNSAAAAVGQAEAAVTDTINTATDAVNSAIGSLTSLANAADISVQLPGGIVAGGNPVAMAAALTAQAQTMTDGAAALVTLPVVQRISLNLEVL